MKYFFRKLRYKYDRDYRELIDEAYSRNEAIDIMSKLHMQIRLDQLKAIRWELSSKIQSSEGADGIYEIGSLPIIWGDGRTYVGWTFDEYLFHLSKAGDQMERALHYLCDETTYWSHHWDFFNNLPLGHEDLGESVPL